jgi:hypothetical protein
MSLGDLQIALGALVTTGTSASRPSRCQSADLDGLDLTAEERTWLDQLTGSPGLAITCRVQRWWREMRLRLTVRLTLAALGAVRSAEMIRAYVDSSPCTSLFYIPEALGFLDCVIREGDATPHLGAVARFERALLLAAVAAPAPSRPTPEPANGNGSEAWRLQPHPAATIIEFAAPPELVLGALLWGKPLPPTVGPACPVLVSPSLPDLWRLATRDEARLFACCQPIDPPERRLADVGSPNIIGHSRHRREDCRRGD